MLLKHGLRALYTTETRASRAVSSNTLQSSPYISRSFVSATRSRGSVAPSTLSIRSSRQTSYWTLSSALGAAALLTLLSLQQTPLNLEAPQDTKEEVESVRIDPSTSQPFPIVLPTPITPLPSTCKELSLVGLGVRTVSFLRVKVYVAGLYLDSDAMKNLSSIAGWKGFKKEWMTKNNGDPSGERLVSELLEQGVTFAIRIVPVRSTDFGHLRDGFTRAVQGRAKLARKQAQLSEASDEALSSSLQALKEAFPRTSLPKGQPLDLLFTPSNSGTGFDLTLEEGGKVLGKIESPRGAAESEFSVARQLLLAYLADKDEISKPFKESVAVGFEQIVQGKGY